ncbi:MAG TPA: hypothetical protein VGN82_19430 [Bosea sp. (in: a-proteobacteria)]|uniref:hypothetical protein n=1 Tax=Bosea sp. (in: a-proteobacteria) TaxID=1871050 RepID=UPI002E0DBDAB|nr:hypothetical protein [Bosea sp. (in: a-proteobacteria)]
MSSIHGRAVLTSLACQLPRFQEKGQGLLWEAGAVLKSSALDGAGGQRAGAPLSQLLGLVQQRMRVIELACKPESARSCGHWLYRIPVGAHASSLKP